MCACEACKVAARWHAVRAGDGRSPRRLSIANALSARLPCCVRVKLAGLDTLGLAAYNGRMGRVVEMDGKQYMDDGKTELCTVLLDSRSTDYDRSSGVWVGVPVANLKLL